ncbi:Fic family protein [Trueperella pecoris]|nr:hypothetical protein [Trueperella pecoris]
MLILIDTGLLQLPILYLSGHIVRHKDEYYRLLNKVTSHGEWEPWILFILGGVEATAKWTLDLVEATDEMRMNLEQEIRSLFPKLPAASLSRLLFSQPYLRIENIVEAGLAQRQTAARWLNDLAEHGFIAKERVGRTNIFVNTRLLQTLFHTSIPE